MKYYLGFEAVADVVFALTALDRRNRRGEMPEYLLGRDDRAALRQVADEAFCELAVGLGTLVADAQLPDGATGDYLLELGGESSLPGSTHLMVRRLLEETMALDVMRLLSLAGGDVAAEKRYESRVTATQERLRGYLDGSFGLVGAVAWRY